MISFVKSIYGSEKTKRCVFKYERFSKILILATNPIKVPDFDQKVLWSNQKTLKASYKLRFTATNAKFRLIPNISPNLGK